MPTIPTHLKDVDALRVYQVGDRKRILTKRVHPEWYQRYAYVLNDEERMFEQPLQELIQDSIARKEFVPEKNYTKTDVIVDQMKADNAERQEMMVNYFSGKKDYKDIQVKKKLPVTAVSSATLANEKERNKIDRLVEHELKRKFILFKLPKNSRWRLIKNSKSIKVKLSGMERERKRLIIVARWGKAIRSVLACLRFWEIFTEIAGTEGITREKEPELGEVSEGVVIFNKNIYKPLVSKTDLDDTAKLTLRNLEILRTAEDVEHVASSLRRILPQFALFPLKHQIIMATVGQLIEIPPDKVIIREGQPPHNFYFMLSGKSVAVKLVGPSYHKENATFEVLNVYEPGSVFGDDGIYDCKYRDYSVSSVTDCQILSVNIDDYIRLSLIPEYGDEIAEHIKFVSQLEMMKTFPLGRLIDEAGDRNIIFVYFTTGRVVTKRSINSDYIFVVKTGHCKMLGKILHDKPADGVYIEEADLTHHEKLMSTTVSVSNSVRKDLNRHFSDAHLEIEKNKSDNEGKFKRTSSRIVSSIKSSKDKGFNTRSNENSSNSKTDTTRSKTSVHRLQTIPEANTPFSSRQSPTIVNALETSRSASVGSLKNRSDLILETGKYVNEQERSRSGLLNTISFANIEQANTPLPASVERKSIKNGASSKRSSRCKQSHYWLRLADLCEGDVFGMDEIDLGDGVGKGPDIAIVSEGCEMVLISKKFLTENMSMEQLNITKSHWRKMGKSIPNESTILNKLTLDKIWSQVKHDTLEEIRTPCMKNR